MPSPLPPPAAATGRRIVGLDLGGTNIKRVVVEVDGDGRVAVIASDINPTPSHGGPAEVCARLLELFADAAGEHAGVAALGLGLPGTFNAQGEGEVLPNLPGDWVGFPVAATVREGVPVPVRLINDARACTLAEATIGAAAGCSTVVCMTLGTGIGGGIVIDGRLHEGRWGIAGEIGHQTVKADGPRCGCGNLGCIEAVARASEVARLGGRSTAAEVYAGAAAGDPRCVKAVAAISGWLGIAVGNLVTVLGPDRVVIGGGIAAAGDVLLVPLRRAVAARATLMPAAEIEIVAAALGPLAGAIGAAVAARSLL